MNSSPCIFSLKFVIWAELHSTKLTFQIRSNILYFIKLCNRNITPMRDLNFSNNFRKIYLRLIIDTMYSMSNITKGLDIRTLVGNSRKTFFLSLRRKTTKIRDKLHDFLELVINYRLFNMIRRQKFLIIFILKFLIFT